jgi:hypothetical protein
MSKVRKIAFAEIAPAKESVFAHQGIPRDAEISERTQALFQQSFDWLQELAEPVAISAAISQQAFEAVFAGEGSNEAEAPLAKIYAQSDSLNLFAATLGQGVSDKISSLFGSNDFALATMMDSAASMAADNVARVLEDDICAARIKNFRSVVLAYSPGYCGWHLSAQKQLFDYLEPGKVGISLNDSYLMQPTKSVSGVLIEGARDIHIFKPKFNFCGSCQTKSCRSRMKNL